MTSKYDEMLDLVKLFNEHPKLNFEVDNGHIYASVSVEGFVEIHFSNTVPESSFKAPRTDIKLDPTLFKALIIWGDILFGEKGKQ